MLFGGVVKVNKYYPAITMDEYKEDFIQNELPFVRATLEWEKFMNEMIAEGVVISDTIKNHETKFKHNLIKEYAYWYNINHEYSSWNVIPVIDCGRICITCTKRT